MSQSDEDPAHSDYRLKFYNTFSARSNTRGCEEKVLYTFLYILRRKTWFIKDCLLYKIIRDCVFFKK